MIRDIVYNGAADADRRVMSNCNGLPDGRAGSDMTIRADGDRSGHTCAGSNMAEIADFAIVLNNTPAVQNDMLPDFCAAINDNAFRNKRTFRNAG